MKDVVVDAKNYKELLIENQQLTEANEKNTATVAKLTTVKFAAQEALKLANSLGNVLDKTISMHPRARNLKCDLETAKQRTLDLHSRLSEALGG